MAAQETLLNGRYRLIAQQGSGGMAVVYKAQDLALGRIVAIKILRPSLTSDASFLARFRQEARNVANLAHPNIVTLHDVGQDGNTYYMVMEFVDSQDLKKLIRAGAPFPLERALHIGIQICAGLGYAHRAGLVHADVKPQNILVDASDRIKITDFGIAQALSHTQPRSRQSVVWGSPHYFSPEQATGETPTPASDVYAIGIVLFEMLTGRLPYNGSDQQELALAHLREQVPHVRDFNPNIPSNIDWVVNKVMSKEPSNRYRTADQLGRILESYEKQLANPSQQAAPPVNVPPPVPSGPSVAPQPSAGGSGVVPAAPSLPPQPIYTPPPAPSSGRPVQPYVQPRQSPTGSMNRISSGATPSEPARPVTGPYRPPAAPAAPHPGDMSSLHSGSMPSYPYAAPQKRLDVATIILGGLAFLAVLGLILLALVVWSAWS
jgi:serine/threonine-protein kinase